MGETFLLPEVLAEVVIVIDKCMQFIQDNVH